MSAILGRLAGRTTRSAFRTPFRAASSEAKSEGEIGGDVLKKGAKRDPELYILGAIMTGAFCLAGYYFGRKPTASTSETPVSMALGTMPWQTEAKGDFKYQYHPNGDKSKPLKNAPSALHATIVPPITLRKSEHELINRYGKDDWPH